MSSTGDVLAQQIGQSFYSDWIEIDQAMIDRFADATLDRQFIHVDPERAARTPFGGTIAHGMLTLSLLPALLERLDRPRLAAVRMGVNYGFDRVRFVNPVRSGSRVRMRATVADVAEKGPDRFQQTLEITIEIENAEKPALVATWINQFFV